MNSFEAGDAAEKIVLAYESNRLGRKYSRFVRHVADNTSLGYDVESIEIPLNGLVRPRLIEVKCLSGSREVFLSAHEVKVLSNLGDCGWLYIVDLKNARVDSTICNPLKTHAGDLTPVTFKLYI